MANLSSFYPQPVVAGTTEGTFTEGNDERVVGAVQSGGAAGGGLSGTYPNPTLAPVLSRNKLWNNWAGGEAITSLVPRYENERWGDVVNVKDWGAVGDGVTDDWLAIQRAIAHSYQRHDVRTLSDDPTDPNNFETYLESFQAGNIQIPKIFNGQGFRTVFFPWGRYAISKPLVVNHGVTLLGTGGQKAQIVAMAGYYGRLIEDRGNYLERTYWPARPASEVFTAAIYEYNATLNIKGLRLNGNGASFVTPSGGRIVTGYDFMRWPLFKNTTVATATGAEGTNTVTTSLQMDLTKQKFLNWRIKFQNHNTEYEITEFASNGTVLTLNQNLTQNVPAGTVVLVGVPRHIAICTNGGEDAVVEQVSMHNFDIGSFEPYGSPAKTFRDVSVWNSDIGLWLETSPALVTKFSGDGNNVWIRAGIWNNMTATIMGLKAESAQSDTFRTFIEHSTGEQSATSNLTLIGGTFNAGNITISGGDNTWQDKALVEIYRRQNLFAGSVMVTGMNWLSNGQYFARLQNSISGNVENLWPRDSAQSGEQNFYYGGVSRMAAGLIERFVEQGYNYRLTPYSFDASVVGKPVLHGAGFLLDGQAGLLGTGTMGRSGSTVTVTTAIPHGLAVGDYVHLFAYPYAGSGLTFPSTDTNGLHNSYYNGVAKVQTIPDATNFTLYANNTGPESGEVMIFAMRYTEMHAIHKNEHRFQMPHLLGRTDNAYTGFGYYDKLRRMIAGVRVPEENKGYVWASGGLSVGGTIGNPTASMLSGAGDPQASAISAPNGSLYLRTDGDASTTLYVRAGAAWKPLSSWNP